MPEGEALRVQSEKFLNDLTKAISFGLPKITFIHGLGNGTLKNKIREELENHPDVDRYGDADVKRFGYGATEVYIKLH